MLRRFFGLSSDRRRDRRFDAGGTRLVCHGHRFPVADLSLGGLRVRHPPPALRVGQTVDITLDLPMPGRPLSVHGRALVVRVSRDEFALRFATAEHHLMRVLHYVIGMLTPLDGLPAAGRGGVQRAAGAGATQLRRIGAQSGR
ncbi:PilZ domain-containing protein [Azospirillum halopraeferens]|uniref:PilZ domain-containing protein n=1 Tax=Azospirillum halopraeferens TaxID=34010 RepID=UPI00048CE3A2|nr:PilZ domain-containing protein [Azospirillum halopraeferens]